MEKENIEIKIIQILFLTQKYHESLLVDLLLMDHEDFVQSVKIFLKYLNRLFSLLFYVFVHMVKRNKIMELMEKLMHKKISKNTKIFLFSDCISYLLEN